MSTEWMKYKRMNWPDGAKGRALNGKTALEALKEEIARREAEDPKKNNDIKEKFTDDLAHALALRIILDAERKGHRK